MLAKLFESYAKMKKIILSILLSLCSTIIVASDAEAEVDKPEFKAVRVFQVHGTRDSCTTSTSLYLDGVCYCTNGNGILAQSVNAWDFCKYDNIIILETDDAETMKHKLGVKAIQGQVKRFFDGAKEEAEEKYGSSNTQQIDDYINQRFHELFKVVVIW